MRNSALIIVITLVISLTAGFALGWFTKRHFTKNKKEIVLDTVIVTDTFTYSNLVPVLVTEHKYVPLDVKDTICKNDTIYIPVIQKIYKGNDFKAWVSGYNAALDSIQIYPKTVYINRSRKEIKWGIGPTIGYGIDKKGFAPFIGIGLYYKLF